MNGHVIDIHSDKHKQPKKTMSYHNPSPETKKAWDGLLELYGFAIVYEHGTWQQIISELSSALKHESVTVQFDKSASLYASYFESSSCLLALYFEVAACNDNIIHKMVFTKGR